VARIRTLAICNVALTVPARILIGMLLDKFRRFPPSPW
jgi:NNP family nitrate/nitrite transporter-like MFS transporter